MKGTGTPMKLYFKYLSIHLKSIMQYKLSFLLTSLGQFLGAFSMLLGICFLMARFHQVKGFTMSEVLLCFSIVMIAFSLAEIFARGFDAFSGIVRNGEFDRIMLRPRNEIFQVLASRFELTRFAKVLQAVLVLIFALCTSEVDWTPLKVLGLGGMIVGGVAMFSGLFLVYAALCFFTLEGLEVMNILTDGGRELGRYPLKIYGEGVLRFFTFVVPLACFQYYPFTYLVGRTNDPLVLLTPLICLAFLLPCYALWRFGVRRYKSNGS